MATRSSELGAILYATESAFGETTTTTGTRLDIVGAPDFTPSWPMIDPGILKQRPHEATQGILGPKGGTLSFEMLLTGLGGSSASAPPASALATLLGACFGQTTTSHSSSITCSGGTATALSASAATGITAGSLVRVGAKGDGRCDGQWVPVSTHAASTINALLAVPTAPSGTDQVYCSRMIYESSTPGTMDTITGLRFRFLSSRQQYVAHGCYLTGIEWMNVSPGEVPRVKLSFTMAWWEAVSATFPDTTATDDYSGSPIAGGSFAWNAVGTATRVTESIRAFRWSTQLSQLQQFGPDGLNEYQTLVGCVRGPSMHTFEIEYDAEASGTNTQGALFDDDANSRAARHFLYSMSIADGRSLGLYVRNAKFIDEYPIQRAVNGQWRKVVKLQAMTGPTTTSDLTMSPWLLGMA